MILGRHWFIYRTVEVQQSGGLPKDQQQEHFIKLMPTCSLSASFMLIRASSGCATSTGLVNSVETSTVHVPFAEDVSEFVHTSPKLNWARESVRKPSGHVSSKLPHTHTHHHEPYRLTL